MMRADGAETHFVKGGDIFAGGCIIYVTAIGEILFALHEFSLREGAIDVGEGDDGNAAVLKVSVKIRLM